MRPQGAIHRPQYRGCARRTYARCDGCPTCFPSPTRLLAMQIRHPQKPHRALRSSSRNAVPPNAFGREPARLQSRNAIHQCLSRAARQLILLAQSATAAGGRSVPSTRSFERRDGALQCNQIAVAAPLQAQCQTEQGLPRARARLGIFSHADQCQLATRRSDAQ